MAKIRESGMPDESMWRSFFKPREILNKLEMTAECGDVVEFGCGYGTFTLAAAGIVSGTVYALDIEPAMVKRVKELAAENGFRNITALQRDFMARGTGVPDESCDYAMLFNILHAENPASLLKESFRVLRAAGKLGIIHWVNDDSTPRGPSMSIRPTPEQVRLWSEQAGFMPLLPAVIDLPPYHYGIVLRKPD